MASKLIAPEEDPLRERIPDTKLIPYVTQMFEELRHSKPERGFVSIFDLYRDYEEGQSSIILEDHTEKVAKVVNEYLAKYEEEVESRPDSIGDEMDSSYNRHKLLKCLLEEASLRGKSILNFNILLAIALPTVFTEDGIGLLGELIFAVQRYMGKVGESLEVVWESLDTLADTLVMQLIVPVYRTAGTYTPENYSAYQDGDGSFLVGMSEQGVESYQNFRLTTLERDKYRCVVTKKFDTYAETGTVATTHRVAHIIPWGLDWDFTRSKAVRNRVGWVMLNIFDASTTGRLSDTLSMKLDQTKNGLTLTREVHRHFEGMHLWLNFDKENQQECTYTIDGDASKIFAVDLPSDRKVVFRKGPDCPERRLLDIHAKLSRVATTSGAINIAKQFTGKGATMYVVKSKDAIEVHPKALELKLLSINCSNEQYS
ncbi:hypothetical protein TWF281_003433 [Arthrobotrys megalospora]